MLLDQKLIDKLAEVDQRISKETAIILDFASELDFLPITEFELNEDTDTFIEKAYHVNGIYFFELKNSGGVSDKELWRNGFLPLWKSAEVIWTPGFKKLRFDAHQSFTEWIPFYIGKCKSVRNRINEHIHQPHDKHTFSMKLKARKNLYGHVFRISWIPFECNKLWHDRTNN